MIGVFFLEFEPPYVEVKIVLPLSESKLFNIYVLSVDRRIRTSHHHKVSRLYLLQHRLKLCG